MVLRLTSQKPHPGTGFLPGAAGPAGGIAGPAARSSGGAEARARPVERPASPARAERPVGQALEPGAPARRRRPTGAERGPSPGGDRRGAGRRFGRPGSFASGSQYPPRHFTHHFCTGGRPFRTAPDSTAVRRGCRHGPIALHRRRAARCAAAEDRRTTASGSEGVAVPRRPAAQPPALGWRPFALNAHDSTRA